MTRQLPSWLRDSGASEQLEEKVWRHTITQSSIEARAILEIERVLQWHGEELVDLERKIAPVEQQQAAQETEAGKKELGDVSQNVSEQIDDMRNAIDELTQLASKVQPALKQSNFQSGTVDDLVHALDETDEEVRSELMSQGIRQAIAEILIAEEGVPSSVVTRAFDEIQKEDADISYQHEPLEELRSRDYHALKNVIRNTEESIYSKLLEGDDDES